MQRSVGNKVYFIFLILFNKLFNVNIYRVCFILLLLLLLLNVIAFAISQLKIKAFVRITVVVHKSCSPLRLSSIMKGKVTNSLKPPLTKSSSVRPLGTEWDARKRRLFETKKTTYRLLKVNHKFLNF